MTPKQAAVVIGCTVGHVRSLIRSGKLKAKAIAMDYGQDFKGPGGWYYDISQKEVERYAKSNQTRGYPRGKKRPTV